MPGVFIATISTSAPRSCDASVSTLNRRRELREPFDAQPIGTQLRGAPLAHEHRDGVTCAREMSAENGADRAGAENRVFGAGGALMDAAKIAPFARCMAGDADFALVSARRDCQAKA